MPGLENSSKMIPFWTFFSYLQKTYLKRVLLEDGSAVDVAAYRAEDNDVILLAYRYTPAKFVEGTALSIQSVLDGYSAETSGTLFIVQNDQSLPLTARS